MGKIFKALQKSKKQPWPEMPRTSPARGVQPPEKDVPKTAAPKKKPPPADKPAEQSASFETRETDLGAIHGLLAGEPVTESPGIDKTAASDAEKAHPKRMMRSFRRSMK